MLFVLLSVLVHLFVIGLILLYHLILLLLGLIPAHTATVAVPVQLPHVTLVSPHSYATTPDDPNAPKNPNVPVEADHNSVLASNSPFPRVHTLMPDISGRAHSNDVTNTRFSPQTRLPIAQVRNQQPSQQQNPNQARSQSQSQAHQQMQQAVVQQQSEAAKPVEHPAPRAKPVQLVDPNGLPVLPPLDAATVLPPNEQAGGGGQPPPSISTVQANIQGDTSGITDHISLAAKQTELGQYLAKVKRAIGSVWEPKVQDQLQLVSIGVVRVHVVIHSNGQVDVSPLDGGYEGNSTLMGISMSSIKEAGPFDEFPPSMKAKYGDTFTDDFTFEVYSAN